MRDIIGTVQDPVRAFVVDCLAPDIPAGSIVWGDQDGPAPAEPYAALFFTPTGSTARDAIEQTTENEATLTGIREAFIEARIFAGAQSVPLAYRIEIGESIPEQYAKLEAAGVATFDVEAARDLSYDKDGKRRRAAGVSFFIRWNESHKFARETIETIEINGTMKSDSGRDYSVEVNV